jgi:hypothetical protein
VEWELQASMGMEEAELKKDNPSEIAEYLIKDNGIEQAIKLAHDGTTKAQLEGDNYTLSVWREVKRSLKEKKMVNPD